jgi:predicted small lipoprotein YifL
MVSEKERENVMRKLTIILILAVVALCGCGEKCSVNTPPWSETEVARMEADDVETVPFAIFRF